MELKVQTPLLLVYKTHSPTSKLGKPGKIRDPLPPGGPLLGWFPKFYPVLSSEVSPNITLISFFEILRNILLANFGPEEHLILFAGLLAALQVVTHACTRQLEV